MKFALFHEIPVAQPRAADSEQSNPNDTREMWQEAVSHLVHCWTNDVAEFSGKHWQLPPRRVLPRPRQSA